MTSSAMAYPRGGHAGTVAVPYSTNAMPTTLSPSRRYSSGSTGTTTSGVGSISSTKLSSYRSSSTFDRPSYYSSGSTSSSGYSSRSSYSSEYRSRYCSPARSLSVSSSSYSDSTTGGVGGGGSGSNSSCNSGISSSNNSNRYSTSLSRDRSENREITSTSLGSLATSAADLYAKYSPANYVPNITASNERNSNNKSSANTAISSSPSLITNGYGTNSTSNNSIFGGNASNNKISTLIKNSSTELLSPAVVQGRPPRAARRSPVNTVINNHEQQPENSAYNEKEGSPTIRAPRNRLQTPRDERCGLNGLRNIGNTCFMNSVIQCLSNTRPLLEYLINEQYLADINTATSSMKGALIKAFSQVIQELWEVGGDHVVNTASLKSQIQRFAPRFIGYSQQDAQEFLRYLLEGLHEDVNRVTVRPQPIHTDIPEHYSDSQKAAESWKRYLRNEDSTIVDVFVGQLRSSLHCTSCGHVSVTLDPFWDLSLPIPTRSGTVKLNQCLEHFTKEEVLDGDEKPTCSKCQMRRKCTKSFSIQKFPKILVIHLKRFSPMERFRGKLNTLVDFPLTGLDLGAFSAPRVAGCTYNLYGVANHSGTTYSGHYTAYCKHPYSGEWHEYNDSRVSSIAARSVVSSEGYVLFYEQQPHSSNL